MGVHYSETKPKYTLDEFKKFTTEFKVGAVLSDGQFYTVEKIAKLCRTRDISEVQKIVDDMVKYGEITAHSNHITYYMTLNQMQAWRSEHGFKLSTHITPKIMPPRFFGAPGREKTENEMFLDAPVHQSGSVTFTLINDDDIQLLMHDLEWLGAFRQEKIPHRWRILCLSAPIARTKLLEWEQKQDHQVFKKHKVLGHNLGFRRELCEIDQIMLDELIMYYLPFSKKLVPFLNKTFETYMPGYINTSSKAKKNTSSEFNAEADSVLINWIIEIIEKYDATSGYPFSVYLQTVLPKSIYDYSVKAIGLDANKYQIQKNKAIKLLDKKGIVTADGYYQPSVVLQVMRDNGYDITLEKYNEFEQLFDFWRKIKRPTAELNWESGDEKIVNNKIHSTVGDKTVIDDPFTESTVNSITESSILQHKIIMAGVESNKPDDSLLVLSNIRSDSDNIGENISEKLSVLSDTFKQQLMKTLYNK